MTDNSKQAAHIAAVRGYNERNYKHVNLMLRYDDADMLERAAAYAGQSRTAYILQAVRERIERDDRPATDHIDSDI